MKIAFFHHSYISDWNNGNAHFARGLATELLALGHELVLFEPANSWSATNLKRNYGNEPLLLFERQYPSLHPTVYDPANFDPGDILDSCDLALVHEWNEPALVRRIAHLRRTGGRFRALFHDTHHRMLSQPKELEKLSLPDFDGVLAFGAVIRDLYLEKGWAARAWTFHEAADTRVFYPRSAKQEADVVWIGNWGDEERSAELREFLVQPVLQAGLSATVHGVRYPPEALQALRAANIQYKGWLANFLAPDIFAHHALTVHVPRRPYAKMLPGIPTIRPFEAMACGIPLISAPWEDTESLFAAGEDYLSAASGSQMRDMMQLIVHDRNFAAALARHGRQTVLARHTCAHRARQLLEIAAESGAAPFSYNAAKREHSTRT